MANISEYEVLVSSSEKETVEEFLLVLSKLPEAFYENAPIIGETRESDGFYVGTISGCCRWSGRDSGLVHALKVMAIEFKTNVELITEEIGLGFSEHIFFKWMTEIDEVTGEARAVLEMHNELNPFIEFRRETLVEALSSYDKMCALAKSLQRHISYQEYCFLRCNVLFFEYDLGFQKADWLADDLFVYGKGLYDAPRYIYSGSVIAEEPTFGDKKEAVTAAKRPVVSYQQFRDVVDKHDYIKSVPEADDVSNEPTESPVASDDESSDSQDASESLYYYFDRGVLVSSEEKPLRELDEKGNLVHGKMPNGHEIWLKWDPKHSWKLLYEKDSDGIEIWYRKNNMYHTRNFNGKDRWFRFGNNEKVKLGYLYAESRFDEDGKCIFRSKKDHRRTWNNLWDDSYTYDLVPEAKEW